MWIIYGYYNIPTIWGFRRIEIKGTSVTKSTYIDNIVDIYSYRKVDVYFVTINFANTGSKRTMIDSVLLNGMPYDDPGWTGTLKPMVFGDLTPKFQVIDGDASYVGILEFSDDCKDPSGNKLMAGGDDHYYVNITIDYDDYKASATIQLISTQETSLSPLLMLAIAIVAVIALAALFILLYKRKGRLSSVEKPE